MKGACRHLFTALQRRRQLAIVELLHNARIVTDPEKLSYLNAEVKKRRAGAKARHSHCLRGRALGAV